jgi:hypothetical protein
LPLHITIEAYNFPVYFIRKSLELSLCQYGTRYDKYIYDSCGINHYNKSEGRTEWGLFAPDPGFFLQSIYYK